MWVNIKCTNVQPSPQLGYLEVDLFITEGLKPQIAKSHFMWCLYMSRSFYGI